jgi:hypothetical protein
MSRSRERVRTSHRYYGATSSFPARPRKNISSRGHAGIGKSVPLYSAGATISPSPSRGDLEAMRFNGNRRELTMRDQRDLTQDVFCVRKSPRRQAHCRAIGGNCQSTLGRGVQGVEAVVGPPAGPNEQMFGAE